jgi:hypothetical protein
VAISFLGLEIVAVPLNGPSLREASIVPGVAARLTRIYNLRDVVEKHNLDGPHKAEKLGYASPEMNPGVMELAYHPNESYKKRSDATGASAATA